MTENPLLGAALAYAARGWPVFPCSPATKAPLTKRGLKDATTHPDMIRGWWGRWPKAMIGLPLGGPTGLFALDFDPREEVDPESGEVTQFTYRQLRADTEAMIGGELPATAASRTPSGGFHIFYRQPEGDEIRNRGNLPPHVDVRGLGGYVIAPPSMREDGKAYAWVDRRDPADCPPEAPPPALVDLLRAPKGGLTNGANRGPQENRSPPDAGDSVRKYALSALDAEARALAGMGSGGRNKALNAAALKMGGFVSAGALSVAMVRAALLEACQTNGLAADDGLRACEATFDSGFKAGLANPRDLSGIEARYPREGGGSRGRGLAPARTRSPQGEAASSSPSADPSAPSAPPAPPGADGFQEPSHMGGRSARRREERWGPEGAWNWAWVWQLAGAIRAVKRASFLPRTDLGNAERWALHHGRDFRHADALGWLGWDGTRWKREGGDPRSYPPMLGRSAIATVRSIQLEARYIKGTGCPDLSASAMAGVRYNPDGRDHVLKWVGPKDDKRPILLSDAHAQFGRDCESSGRIGAIASLARLQPGISVNPDCFDRQPMLFNVANGTLEFHRPARKGERARVFLRRHRRDDMLTKASPVFFDPEAGAPLYTAFFERVQPSPEMRRFLHAWAGYTLTGDTGEQCFLIAHGTEGGNGKSTWELARAYVMGDYAQKVKVETFLDGNFEQSGAQASPDIARLPGARMVYTSEPKAGKRFAEDLIKVVTGSEVVTARHLNRDFFDFIPEMKISVACNRPPEASDDKAFWRRVRLTPWDVSVPEGERDKHLGHKLQGEGAGILNYMIAGALDWMEGGLPVPDAVTEATQRYQDESDPLGRFLRLAVTPDRLCRVQSSHLFDIFAAWCAFTGEKEWTQTYFSRKLTAKGFQKITSNNVYWLAMRPVLEPEAFGERQYDSHGKMTGWKAHEALDESRVPKDGAYLDPTAKARAGSIEGEDSTPAGAVEEAAAGMPPAAPRPQGNPYDDDW